jgi:hypothetical protein
VPDPVAIAWALVAAAAAAAAVALAATGAARWVAAARLRAVGWPLALATGLVAGGLMLGIRPTGLPGIDRDRFLLVVLPLAVAVEVALAAVRPPDWLRWIVRLGLAASIAPVLLFGSVFMVAPPPPAGTGWTSLERVLIFGAVALAIATQWAAVVAFDRRRPGLLAPAAVATAAIATGVATILTGYLSAGLLAVVLAAALVGACIVAALVARAPAEGGLVVALACQAATLVSGHFFGALPAWMAAVLLALPALAWLAEVPRALANRGGVRP